MKSEVLPKSLQDAFSPPPKSHAVRAKLALARTILLAAIRRLHAPLSLLSGTAATTTRRMDKRSKPTTPEASTPPAEDTTE